MKRSFFLSSAFLASLLAGCESGAIIGTKDFAPLVQTASLAPAEAGTQAEPRESTALAYGAASDAVPSARGEIERIVERHAHERGVPVGLAKAMVTIESNYNPNVTGRLGEVGLMQIKYETARSMGYEGSRAGLYDPETNIRFGMRYLAAAYEAGNGSICTAILKYQGGLRATRHSDWTRRNCDRAQAMMASTT